MKPAFEAMSLQIQAATAEPEDYTGEDGQMCIRDSSHTIHIEVPPNPFWASIGLSVTPLSVSYTHLDVYKRQAYALQS